MNDRKSALLFVGAVALIMLMASGATAQLCSDDNDCTGDDAWSVGLRFSLSGTSIVGLYGLFIDGFESGDRIAWSTVTGGP